MNMYIFQLKFLQSNDGAGYGDHEKLYFNEMDISYCCSQLLDGKVISQTLPTLHTQKKKKTVHILNDTKTVLILTYFRWIEKVIKLEVMEFILTGQEILIETPIFTSKRRELN